MGDRPPASRSRARPGRTPLPYPKTGTRAGTRYFPSETVSCERTRARDANGRAEGPLLTERPAGAMPQSRGATPEGEHHERHAL